MPHGFALPNVGLSLIFLLMICTAPISSLRFRLHTKPGMHTTSTAPNADIADSAPVNLTVCTFATDGNLNDVQATSARFGVHLNVISLDSKNLEPHMGIFNKKLRAILSVASELSPDAVMVAVDAFDVLIGRPIEDMYWSFREMMGRRNDFLLFNAEKNCYPDPDLEKAYPEIQSPWRYLNAGAFIGNAGAVKAALQPKLESITKNTDDQRLWTRLYLDDIAAGSDVIHIDSGCTIFQTLWGVQPGEMLLTENGWYNTVTRSSPAVFHSNGDHSKVWTFIYPGIQVFASSTGVELADRFMAKRIARSDE